MKIHCQDYCYRSHCIISIYPFFIITAHMPKTTTRRQTRRQTRRRTTTPRTRAPQTLFTAQHFPLQPTHPLARATRTVRYANLKPCKRPPYAPSSYQEVVLPKAIAGCHPKRPKRTACRATAPPTRTTCSCVGKANRHGRTRACSTVGTSAHVTLTHACRQCACCATRTSVSRAPFATSKKAQSTPSSSLTTKRTPSA